MQSSGPLRQDNNLSMNALALHPLAASDPAAAQEVYAAWTDHVVKGTKSSYSTCVKKYLSWCAARALVPWPVDLPMLCAWLLDLESTVKPTSMRMYVAGINQQVLEGYQWTLDGNEGVRRTMRFLKRKYPSSPKAFKFVIDMRTLQAIFREVPGWPSPLSMSHNDRVYVGASLAAVTGFLRGGEFLSSSKSDRQVLRSSDVAIMKGQEGSALHIKIPQPKARWYLTHSEVVCFERDNHMCPGK